MANKLEIGEYPASHGPSDFECFGPACTKDGQFEGTMIVDMGCFKQPTPEHPDGVDSNKYYHAAVVQSTITKEFGCYFEYGRTGAKNPQFQFLMCSSKAEAEKEYVKQCRSKNDKRGEWVTHPKLGKMLQAKKDKDCYLVRPQATRSTGLPSARTIKTTEGAKQPLNIKAESTATKSSKPTKIIDKQTLSLLRDLNVGTVTYTRGAMSDSSIPTQIALDEARDILGEARKRISVVGTKIDDQIKDKELVNLTSMMYSRIPKKKDRSAQPKDWILSQDNILAWDNDIDAFEQALYTADMSLSTSEADPFDGMPLNMEWIAPTSDIGKYLYSWWPKAATKAHSYGALKIKNIWKIHRHGDDKEFQTHQKRILNDIKEYRGEHRPMHQTTNDRPDLTTEEKKAYWQSNSALVFHGTRSVNVTGILRTNLRLPSQLTGVVITGAMFGSGIYYADSWGKSAGYTSLHNSYWSRGSGAVTGRDAFMFACDVTMGCPHLAPRSHGYTHYPNGTHTIFGKGGFSGVINNEWIVFDRKPLIRYLAEFTC